jgi:hypothetical protein
MATALLSALPEKYQSPFGKESWRLREKNVRGFLVTLAAEMPERSKDSDFRRKYDRPVTITREFVTQR